MTYRLDLFDSSGNRQAVLQDEIIVSAELSLAIDGAPSVSVTIPQDCDKASFINPQYYLKIWNTETGAYEHSIFRLYDPEIIDSDSELLIKATYQGILTRLSEEYVDSYDTTDTGKAFSTVISELLAYQVNAPEITVGTIEPTQTIAIAAESSDIYSVLNNIRSAYGGWFEVDSLYRLNWYNDNTGDPVRQIRRSKNLKAISYTPQYQSLVNRVYAYGKGEGDARINLSSYNDYLGVVKFSNGEAAPTPGQTAYIGSGGAYIVSIIIVDSVLISGAYSDNSAIGYIIYYKTGTTETPNIGQEIAQTPIAPTTIYGKITGIIKAPPNEYIEDTASQATYGVRARKYIDKSITHPTTLIKYAIQILEAQKDPPYQYTVDVLNLADVAGYDYSLESLGLDTRVRVIDDLLGVDVSTSIVSLGLDLLAPENIQVGLSTIKNDISDLFSDILNIQDISQSVATQIGAGQVTVLGTFSVIDWVTGGTTTIDGGNITAGTVTTSELNFVPVIGGEDTDVIATINASEEEGLVISADKISLTAKGINTYTQASAPTDDLKEGDLWFDSDDNNKCYRWTGSAWEDSELANTGNIVATINLSSEGVQISGNLIEITGSTSFASGYDPSDKVDDLGGQYDSAASGARVRIFPDTNTGIQVVDGSSNDVFKCLVGGTDVGDVIIGDYAGGAGIKWDNSAETLDIQGTLTACTIGSGSQVTIDGDIATADGKLEIKTTGIKLKKSADDTTYIDLVQDTAQIYMYDSSTQRVQITPSGNIRLDSDAGIPIDINSTSDADCVDILTAQTNRRCIVASSTPRSTSTAYATIHATNNTTNGYAISAYGKIYCDDNVSIDSLNVANTSSLHATTITGDLTMAGDADITGVDTLSASTITATNSISALFILGNRIRIGDSNHYLYLVGNDLYYWDGSSSTKIN
jgi:hypothetical protein